MLGALVPLVKGFYLVQSLDFAVAKFEIMLRKFSFNLQKKLTILKDWTNGG